MTDSKAHIEEPLAIGCLETGNRLIQAPLAGISGTAFRLQSRRFGAGLVYTEMVSSHGVHYRNRRTLSLLELEKGEHPVAVQIFGNQPEIMAEAAGAAVANGAVVVDINMGCPVPKVVKTGAGVALMKDEDLAVKIAEEVVEAAGGVPVTAKIRSGAGRSVTALSIALRLEDAGVAAICIHPRLGAQGRKGRADHSVTAGLASRLSVPVIASGDIGSVEMARSLLEEAGCGGLMVGRPALGNPWLFPDLLAGREPYGRPLDEVITELGRFYRDAAAHMGGERAARYMRKFYIWYSSRFKPGARLRAALRRAGDFQEAKQLLETLAVS